MLLKTHDHDELMSSEILALDFGHTHRRKFLMNATLRDRSYLQNFLRLWNRMWGKGEDKTGGWIVVY
jgi:hypothetical protein